MTGRVLSPVDHDERCCMTVAGATEPHDICPGIPVSGRVLSPPTPRCERCGEPIRKTNWALGPGWNHENGDSRCYMGHAVGPRYWEEENADA